MQVEFDWDNANIEHIGRHDVLPHEAEEVIHNKPVTLGASVDKGEPRVTQIGYTNMERILVVVTTQRGSRIRVVTSYPAGRRLRRVYIDRKRGGQHEGF